MKRYRRRAVASENLRVPHSRRVIEREVSVVTGRCGHGRPCSMRIGLPDRELFVASSGN